MLIEKQGLHEALEKATGETMENMVFSEIVPCEGDDFLENSKDLIWSSIVMKVPIAGEMTICMPIAMLKEIVEDVYSEPGGMPEEPAADGCDEEPAEAEDPERMQLIRDTLGEVANTVVGLLLSHLVPADQEFGVGLPVTEIGMPDVSDADVTFFSYEEHCFMVAVETELLADSDE